MPRVNNSSSHSFSVYVGITKLTHLFVHNLVYILYSITVYRVPKNLKNLPKKENTPVEFIWVSKVFIIAVGNYGIFRSKFLKRQEISRNLRNILVKFFSTILVSFKETSLRPDSNLDCVTLLPMSHTCILVSIYVIVAGVLNVVLF